MKKLINTCPDELEWEYLVGESLIGERMIVPALLKMIKDKKNPLALRKSLEEQLRDESYHFSEYKKLLGCKSNIPGSGYDADLEEFVDQLPNTTLKLYALQGMLEGISLGALEHRLKHWNKSPSFDFDTEVYEDEIKHVSLSYDHFEDLIGEEGVVEASDFKKITNGINNIFVKGFNGQVMLDVINHKSAFKTSAKEIDQSPAMHVFKENSKVTTISNKNKFLNVYAQYATN